MKISVNESIFKNILNEIRTTYHATQRLFGRLNDFKLPKNYIDKIDNMIFDLELKNNTEMNAILLDVIPEFPYIKSYKKPTEWSKGRYYYRAIENGKDVFGNEIWAITKNNSIVTLLVQLNKTKSSESELKRVFGRGEDINIYYNISDVPSL